MLMKLKVEVRKRLTVLSALYRERLAERPKEQPWVELGRDAPDLLRMRIEAANLLIEHHLADFTLAEMIGIIQNEYDIV